LQSFEVTNFGVSTTTLEDVFLKVGEDHTVTPDSSTANNYGIGTDRAYESNTFMAQIIGIMKRKLTYASNDFITIPLIALPAATAIAVAIIVNLKIISSDSLINNLFASGLYVGGYLGAPGCF
jgi:hypothetical protein